MNADNNSPTQIADRYKNKLEDVCDADIDDVILVDDGCLRLSLSNARSPDLRAIFDAVGNCEVTRIGGQLHLRTMAPVAEVAK